MRRRRRRRRRTEEGAARIDNWCQKERKKIRIGDRNDKTEVAMGERCKV